MQKQQTTYVRPSRRKHEMILPDISSLTADEYTMRQTADMTGKTRQRIQQIVEELELGFVEDPYGNGSKTRILTRDDVIKIIDKIRETGSTHMPRRASA